MLTESQVNKIRELVSVDKEPGNLFRTLAYVVEEVGELSEALQDKSREDQLRETLDVIISAEAMYQALGGGPQFAHKHIDEQLRKWRLKASASGACMKNAVGRLFRLEGVLYVKTEDGELIDGRDYNCVCLSGDKAGELCNKDEIFRVYQEPV